MSEITIENMPEEVLAEIFKWLDPESLKNAMLTSKDLQGIIERNIPWSLNLRCLNSGHVDAWVDPMLASNRKFHKVMMAGLNGSWWNLESNRFLEFFSNHGGNIRQLSLFNSEQFFFNSAISNMGAVLYQLFETMPKLKKLKMKGTDVFEDLPAELLPALQKLPQLKTLEMVDSTVELLMFFKNCQLQTLKILFSKDCQPREPLLSFLSSQKDLEVLALRSLDYGRSKLFESPIPAGFIPFKLKKLSLQGINLRKTPNDYNNLMMFMKLHVKTLEELELGRSFPDFFFEFIFAQFKKLKTLSLIESAVPRDKRFYERLQANISITNLQLTGEETSNDNIAFALKHLVSQLPSIESLSLLGYFDNSVAKHIAENLKELKNLTIATFNGQAFDGVQFQALQSLRILDLNASIDWDAFTKANPGIIDLSIASIWDPQDLDIQTITANLKIHKLTIEDNEMNCDEKFFNVVRENCPELKSLELKAFAKKVDISTVADIPGLRFRDNEYYWEQYKSEGNFWNQADYDGGIPADDYNWTGEAAEVDPDMVDPFDLHLMAEDFDSDDDYDNYNRFDDDDDRFDDYGSHSPQHYFAGQYYADLNDIYDYVDDFGRGQYINED